MIRRLARSAAAALRPGRQRVRTPTVLQLEVVECGAACLSMVLGYFGRHVPLEELRQACGVTRDGSKASNIIKAARRFGLNAKGFKKDPEKLRELPLPLVVFWNFNHYVVVEGFDRDRVFLNDPASGPRTVSSAEFDESFTGVVLAFEPGPEFRAGGRRPSAARGLRERLAGSGTALGFIVLVNLCLILPGLVVPAFARIFIDYYLVEHLTGWLYPLLAGMVATAVVRAALTGLQQHYLTRLQARLALAAAGRFLWHVLQLPVTFFVHRQAGEIGNRMMLNDRLAGTTSSGLTLACLNLVSVLFYLAIMAQYDLPLAAVAAGFGTLELLCLWGTARLLNDRSQRLQLDEGKLGAVTLQGLSMVDSFKATGTEALFFRRWAGAHAKVVNAEQDVGRLRRLLGAVPPLLSALSTAAIILVGGLRVMDGAITIGMLVALQGLAASFFAPISGLVSFGAQLQETNGAIQRLDDVLRHPSDSAFRAPAVARQPLSRLSGALRVRDLAFGFSPLDPPLIDGFSLDLEPGDRVALVGASGSGKSTVGKLIAGLYEPSGGTIELDGRPIGAIDRGVLRGSVAYVDQTVALFEGTVRDNITLWDPTLRDQRIVAAARDAVIHDEIAQRPGGYDQPVDDGGRNFSGGQRQRVAIARALVLNPALLVLDEATSALDPLSEHLFMENLRRRGCTCIVIAHRLSTVRDCDQILVLDHGTIVQRGRHAALSAVPGPYRALLES